MATTTTTAAAGEGGGGDHEEPFGTTAIPTDAVRVKFDEAKMNAAFFNGTNGPALAQQPRIEEIAIYDASKNETLDPLIRLNGSLIDVNSQFVVYTVKNGLIRVMHRHSAMRALLRGHNNQIVTDIAFFHNGDVVGTVGNDKKGARSTLIVWRVFEKAPEIGYERLLEITNLDYGGAPDLSLSRLIWHPFNPNQFWMTHSTAKSKQVATLVESTRIRTTLARHQDPKDKDANQQHAVCQWHSPYCVMENALQLREPDDQSDGQLVDLCWSGRDARHVLSVHRNGRIVLWDLKAKEESGGLDASGDDDDDEEGDGHTILPKKLFVLREEGVEQSRCLFLPHEQSVSLQDQENLEPLTTCFVTASATNSTVTLWSAFAQTKATEPHQPGARVNPTKLQEISIGLAKPSSFVLGACFGNNAQGMQRPPSSFLLMGSRDTGRLYALHVKAEFPKSENSETAENRAANTSPLCAGIDYMVPFSLKHPVYSWSLICKATEDVTDDDDDTEGSGFDMNAHAYQSKAVQTLIVTSKMCLPPRSTKAGVYTVEALEGPYAPKASGGTTEEPAYEEEDYDVEDDDDDDNEEFVDAVDSAPAAPASGGGGLFPGAPNPFANWLGAIAGGSSAPAPADTTTVTKEEEDLPTPPAPSALPMPPGISAPTPQKTTPPPPPPGIVSPPPGLASPVGNVAASNEETFLNPLELLAKSMGVNQPKAVDSNATPKKNNNRQKSKSPRRNRNKSPRKSRSPNRSQNNKKGNTGDKNAKTPFPEGKVQILKRDANTSAGIAPPLPADPSVLSDPALMAAAGIPIPPNLPSQSQQQTSPALDPSVLEEQVKKSVETAMASIVVPAVQKSVQESFSTLARPLQNSMNSLSKNGVSVNSDDLTEALDVETPLKAAFASSLRNVIVPSLESITNQVLQQVQASMPKPPPPPKDDSKLLAALVQQLTAMTSKMDALAAEVQELRKTVSDQAAAAAKQAEAVAAAAAQQNRSASGGNGGPAQNNGGGKQGQSEDFVQIRTYIDSFLSRGKYEEAFTKAVATSTPQMAVYCCARSHLQKVLSGNTPALSQPILICLMQQLSAALAGTQSPQEMQIEVAWLQEITLAMNPVDPSIAQHVPKVLRQLVANVNARLAAEGTGPFRRPLQMLLNSLMGMQLQLGK